MRIEMRRMSDVRKLAIFSCEEDNSDRRYSIQKWIEMGTGRDVTPAVLHNVRKEFWRICSLVEANGHVLLVERETFARNSCITYVTSVTLAKLSSTTRKLLQRNARTRAQQRDAYGAPSDRLLDHVNRLPDKPRKMISGWLFPELQVLDAANKKERKELKKLLP
jgi:hypothetical protein